MFESGADDKAAVFALGCTSPTEANRGSGRWIELSLDSTDLAPNAATLGAGTTTGQALADVDWNSIGGFGSDNDVLAALFTASMKIGVMELNRPEDVEWNPTDRRIYIAFTSHGRPYALSQDGVMKNDGTGGIGGEEERRDDEGAVFVMEEGDTADPAGSGTFTFWAAWQGQRGNGEFDAENPDNIMIDAEGGVWFGTDGNYSSSRGTVDSLYYLDLDPRTRAGCGGRSHAHVRQGFPRDLWTQQFGSHRARLQLEHAHDFLQCPTSRGGQRDEHVAERLSSSAPTKEPSAGEREGIPLARKEPSAGEREGDTPRKQEPSAPGARGRPSQKIAHEGDTPRKYKKVAGVHPPRPASPATRRVALVAFCLLTIGCAETQHPAPYDPLAYARERIGEVTNQEAVIPPQCYTKTDGQFNPCWTCHVEQTPRNHKADWVLQTAYAFSDLGLTNHWSNLFDDLGPEIDAISDAEMLAHIRADNYTPFREAMSRVANYAGWMPDIDLARGFDAEGFAVDGSWWRSFRFKPFAGTFWPTNGATDEVMIRLPAMFRQTLDGEESVAIYKANLAILEASLTNGGALDAPVERDIEPVDETVAGIDLNGDGKLTDGVTRIKGLPAYYVGAASHLPVKKNLYPKHTEFLHTVRYIDLDRPNALSTRLKEARYSIKYKETDRWSINRYYAEEEENKDEEILPLFGGNGAIGLLNEYGWQLQGFIEDAEGRLRAQTDQEHYYCMGCHGGIGVTVDQTFALPRKVPGADGWAEMSLAGIPDVPQAGHAEPEILTYFRRAGGGDEFRNNDEMIERFFPDGELDEAELHRAAVGGDRDIRHVILPSVERSYRLNKAYMALVRRQRFDVGRDPMPTPPANVFQRIEEISAGLPADRIYRDGTLWLDWPSASGDTGVSD